MFRIHRDVRFSRDKSPYKTHAAAHFRHERAKDAHAPGFYLHLEPRRVMFGAGMWRAEPSALSQIRKAIADDARLWSGMKSAKSMARFGGLSREDALARAPKGFDPDHPLIEDLKLKSFFVMAQASEADAALPGFVTQAAKAYADAAPLMRFLCRAVKVRF